MRSQNEQQKVSAVGFFKSTDEATKPVIYPYMQTAEYKRKMEELQKELATPDDRYNFKKALQEYHRNPPRDPNRYDAHGW